MEQRIKIINKIRRQSNYIINKCNKFPKIGELFYQEEKKLKNLLAKINQCFFEIEKLFIKSEIRCDAIKLIYQDYSKFYKCTLEELNCQSLTLDEYNRARREKDPTCDYGFMLYSNQEFLDDTYLKTDNFVKKMQLAINDVLLEYKTGNIQQTENRLTNNYKKLSGKLISILSLNTDAYIEIFSIENYLRAYIVVKYKIEYKNDNLIELFKENTKIEKKALSRKQEDENNGWLEPRGKTLLSYLDFDELKTIIIQNNNWNIFKRDFPNQDFIRIRFDELYQIRNKIAHNANISQQEFDMIKMYSNQIYKQLQKYDEDIKLAEI